MGSRQPTTPTAKWTPLLTRARQPAPRAGPAGRTSRAEGRNPIGPGAGRQSSTARQPRPHVPRGPTRPQGSSVGLGQGLTAHRWARLGIGGTRPTPGPITPITDSDWTYQWADGLTAHASGIAHRYRLLRMCYPRRPTITGAGPSTRVFPVRPAPGHNAGRAQGHLHRAHPRAYAVLHYTAASSRRLVSQR